MKQFLLIRYCAVLMSCSLISADISQAGFGGRGGGGGGFRGGGGGGGISRPSGNISRPNISAPKPNISRPSQPISRPSIPSAPSSRPNIRTVLRHYLPCLEIVRAHFPAIFRMLGTIDLRCPEMETDLLYLGMEIVRPCPEMAIVQIYLAISLIPEIVPMAVDLVRLPED